MESDPSVEMSVAGDLPVLESIRDNYLLENHASNLSERITAAQEIQPTLFFDNSDNAEQFFKEQQGHFISVALDAKGEPTGDFIMKSKETGEYKEGSLNPELMKTINEMLKSPENYDRLNRLLELSDSISPEQVQGQWNTITWQNKSLAEGYGKPFDPDSSPGGPSVV